MGRKYSGRRPEDQPIYTKPYNMDFEKRRLFVPVAIGSPTPGPGIGMKQHGNEWHTPDFAEEGWILDGGSAIIDISDSITMIYDLGGAS